MRSDLGRLSDEALLGSAREEPARIGEFYARHEASILAFFLRRTGDADVAADLAAETFADVVAHCRRGGRVREPRGWLFAIARGKLADYVRRGYVADRARRRLGMERMVWSDDELDRVVAVASKVTDLELDRALGVLPIEQRRAVLSRVVDEHPYPVIAAELGTSQAVVRQRVHRGLARLRSLLKEGS